MNKNTQTTKKLSTASMAMVCSLTIALLVFVYPTNTVQAQAQVVAKSTEVQPLTGFCYSNYNYVDVDGPVTWSAEAQGGTGDYSYSWVGTEGLRGTTKSVKVAYESVGYKIAGVRISSGGKTINVNCYYPLEVGNVRQAGSTVPDAKTLFGASVAKPSSNNNGANTVSRNNQNPQIVVAQGNNPVKVSATKTTSANTKSAPKTVVSNSADINKAATALRSKGYNVELPDSMGNNSTAAAIFSLKNVPWSSLIVVIIFILSAAAIYQLMGKKA